MSYVMVTADFPGILASDRQKIYKCLEDKKWNKVTELGRDIDTVWYASFKEDVLQQTCISTTIEEFVNCSKPYCRVKLAIQWGPNKPTFQGLS